MKERGISVVRASPVNRRPWKRLQQYSSILRKEREKLGQLHYLHSAHDVNTPDNTRHKMGFVDAQQAVYFHPPGLVVGTVATTVATSSNGNGKTASRRRYAWKMQEIFM